MEVGGCFVVCFASGAWAVIWWVLEVHGVMLNLMACAILIMWIYAKAAFTMFYCGWCAELPRIRGFCSKMGT